MSLHKLKLVHYSDRPISQLKPKPQDAKPNMKPRGLWVSVENRGSFGWREWCLSEDFALSALTRPYLVKLADDAHILQISSNEELDGFHVMHSEPIMDGISSCNIRWHEVAKLYQGIIISPYLLERRYHHEMFWYYGWDCASGCIWDRAAIKSIRFMPVESLRNTAVITKKNWKKPAY